MVNLYFFPLSVKYLATVWRKPEISHPPRVKTRLEVDSNPLNCPWLWRQSFIQDWKVMLWGASGKRSVRTSVDTLVKCS